MKRILQSVRILLLCFGLFGFSNLTAQNFETNIWASTKFEFSPIKKWTFGVSDQVRYQVTGPRRLDDLLTELEAEYKLNKIFQVGHDLRFSLIHPELRSAIHVSAKEKFEDFRLSYRLRLTNSFYQRSFTSSFIRNKFSLGYNFSKIVDPQLSMEIFHQRFGNALRYSQLRFGAELDFNVSKLIDISTFYLREKELTENTIGHIYGVKVGFNF